MGDRGEKYHQKGAEGLKMGVDKETKVLYYLIVPRGGCRKGGQSPDRDFSKECQRDTSEVGSL